MSALFALEAEHGGTLVCGIDEAGRGPLAGPVIAACVHVPADLRGEAFWHDVRDSKKLSDKKKDMLFDAIRACCPHGIAEASATEIDALNIHHATLLAMKRAFEAMLRDFPAAAPGMALVDGKFTPALPCAAKALVGGDGRSKSIGAASILAKVTRDRIMHGLHENHPHYGWLSNKGYGTAEHLEGIAIYGVTRTTANPMRR